MKKGFIGLVFLWVTQICCAQFSLRSDQPIKLACDNAEEKVVQTALKLFMRDYQSVFSASAAVDARQGNIIVGTVGKSLLLKAVSADVSALAGKKQAFLLQVLPDGKLLVAGSDSHGTAYGIMELSRLIGVSLGMVGGCNTGEEDFFCAVGRVSDIAISFRGISGYIYQ